MKTIKNKLFLTTAILALASCADNTYLGDQEGNTQGGGAISFGSSTPQLTRANGETAAQELGYSFAVYATKTVSSTTSNVFAQNSYGAPSNTPYWVWYNTSTANTTTSNTANWEYVGGTGVKNLPDNKTFTLNNAQEIKYWDNSATQYDFVAYKAKEVGTSTPAAATISNLTTNGFTVAGTPAQLAALYIADKKVIEKNSTEFGHEVEFTFRKAATKVRLGIYETVPGYNVKDVKFKYNTSNNSTTKAILDGKFVGNSTESKEFNVTYDATSKRAVIVPSASASNTTYYDFGAFTSDGTNYLGETSISPTWANPSVSDHYIAVFPNTASENIADMTLTIDYTLVNTTSGETINMTNQTATVPAAYMTWKPNYAYTYLFKITDDKLTPITFDAVTIDDGEGNQQTITTVDNPSITTYQNGTDVTVSNEYVGSKPIYVVVGTGTELSVGTNANLYTAVAQGGYTGGITEASVANALKTTANASGAYVVTDTGGKTLTVTPANTSLTAFTEIPASDSPTGVALTINGATFTATAGTTYVFEYIIPTYTQASGTYVANTKYYTDNTGTTEVDTSGFTAGTTDVSSYYVANYSTPASKHYKVIKVAAAS